MGAARLAIGLTCAALVTVGWAAGCDDPDSTGDPRRLGVSHANEPAFTWREAVEHPPNVAFEELGEADCDPERRLPALSPANRGYFAEDPRKCDFPRGSGAREALYFVDAILYSESMTTAVVLRPTDNPPLTPKILDTFHLPRMQVVRRRIVEWAGRPHRVLSFRRRILRGNIDRQSPIAIDVVAKADEPDRVAFVRVALASRWPYSIEHVQISDPVPVGRRLVLPRITGGSVLERQLAVRLQLGGLSVFRQRSFPMRVTPDDPVFEERTFEGVVSGGRRDDGEEQAWRSGVRDYARRWQERQRDVGREPTPVEWNLHVTQTAGWGRLAQLTRAIESDTESEFWLVGRLGEQFRDQLEWFTRVRARRLRFSEPSDADEEEVPLQVTVSLEGLDVSVGGDEIAPRDGCPSEGPTYCLTEDVDVGELVETARRRQNKGEFKESFRSLQRLLGAYDWRRFYNRVSKLATELESNRRARLEPTADVPMAVGLRAYELLQRRVAGPETDGCLKQLPEDQEIEDVGPCRNESREMESLYEATILRPE